MLSDVPLTFEAMDINTGFVLYETTLKNDHNNLEKPVNLTVNSVRDRAIIYLDQVHRIVHRALLSKHVCSTVWLFLQVQVGTMSRLKGNTTMSLILNRPVHKLSILIENQGRINYGNFLEDRKVIITHTLLKLIHRCVKAAYTWFP